MFRRRSLLRLRAVLLASFASFASTAVGAAQEPSTVPIDLLLQSADDANEARRYADAESLATTVLDRLDASGTTDPRAFARANVALGRSLLARRNLADPRTLEAPERAWNALEGLGDEFDPLRAEAQACWGASLVDARRYEEALEHTQLALDVQRRLRGQSSEPVASTLRIHGRALEGVGEFDAAMGAFSEALAIRRALDLPRDDMVGILLTDVARIDLAEGDSELARKHLAESLHEFDARLGVNDPASIHASQRLAALEFSAGDFSRSVELARRGLAIAETAPDFDPMKIAVIRSSMSLPLIELGDYVGARRQLEAAIPILEPRLGVAHPRSTHDRTMLANAMAGAGDTTAALAELHALRATIAADTTGTNAGVLSEALSFEAELQERTDPRAALERLVEAESIERQKPRSNLMTMLMAQKLSAHGRLGDWSAVDALAESVRVAIDSSRVRGSTYESFALGCWSDAEARRGDLGSAFRLALESARISRESMLRNLKTLPDREGLRLAGNRWTTAELVVGCAREMPDSVATAWDELIRWRGLVTSEIVSRRPPRRGADAGVREAHVRWLDARGRLARLEVQLASGDGAEEADLEEARAEVERTERAWAHVAPRDERQRSATDFGLPDIRGAIPPDAVLVAFSSCYLRDDPEHLVAFVARRRGPVRLVDLGRASEIQSALATWRSLAATSPRTGSNVEESCLREGRNVRALIWDRLTTTIGDAMDVYLVPAGPLHSLPWSALPNDDGTYLVETGPTCHVLLSERDLLGIGTPASSKRDRLLAIGGVDFDRTDAATLEPDSSKPMLLASATRAALTDCSGRMPSAFAPLPGTEREVHDLEARSGRLDLLTGAHATETAFKAAAPGHAWIHVATHGFVLEDSCRATSVGTRGVGGYEPIDAERSRPTSEASVAIATDPWLGARAFLALAGANRAREHDDENEGWLTAGEVSTLDLRDTRWVVLSACRSGIASVWSSDGVLGMRRAFHLAGVRSVVASLWDVDDDATREWMRELYAARDGGLIDASDAARRACIETLRTRRSDGRSTHPFYWGAFTVSGG